MPDVMITSDEAKTIVYQFLMDNPSFWKKYTDNPELLTIYTLGESTQDEGKFWIINVYARVPLSVEKMNDLNPSGTLAGGPPYPWIGQYEVNTSSGALSNYNVRTEYDKVIAKAMAIVRQHRIG